MKLYRRLLQWILVKIQDICFLIKIRLLFFLNC